MRDRLRVSRFPAGRQYGQELPGQESPGQGSPRQALQPRNSLSGHKAMRQGTDFQPGGTPPIFTLQNIHIPHGINRLATVQPQNTPPFVHPRAYNRSTHTKARQCRNGNRCALSASSDQAK